MNGHLSLALPEVGTIRKGAAKNPDGTVGFDLKDRFRVAFYPGAAEYQKLFEESYKTLKPERIRAMLLSRSVWESWSWANEAHNAGRMIAKADDTHYFVLRDALTGEYLVKNGEPHRSFIPGDVITYKRGDKEYVLKLRTVGRLRLFLPDLGRLVQFTLKTTSYYDRLNIDRQLASIQSLADTLSGGNAAGIPLFIFRMEQEITWNKKDGSAARIKKWLVNIEADPDWVRAAVARLSNFALTGQTVAGLLEPLTPSSRVEGQREPEADEEENGILEGEVSEDLSDEDPTEAPPKPVAPPVADPTMNVNHLDGKLTNYLIAQGIFKNEHNAAAIMKQIIPDKAPFAAFVAKAKNYRAWRERLTNGGIDKTEAILLSVEKANAGEACPVEGQEDNPQPQ